LERLPFENQRRVCREVPEIIKQKMPNVIFSENIEIALGELNLLK